MLFVKHKSNSFISGAPNQQAALLLSVPFAARPTAPPAQTERKVKGTQERHSSVGVARVVVTTVRFVDHIWMYRS